MIVQLLFVSSPSLFELQPSASVVVLRLTMLRETNVMPMYLQK